MFPTREWGGGTTKLHTACVALELYNWEQKISFQLRTSEKSCSKTVCFLVHSTLIIHQSRCSQEQFTLQHLFWKSTCPMFSQGPLGAFSSTTLILGSSYRDFSPLSQKCLGAIHSATSILEINMAHVLSGVLRSLSQCNIHSQKSTCCLF